MAAAPRAAQPGGPKRKWSIEAAPKINALALAIDGPVQVHPFAANPDVRLVDAPRAADRACKSAPAPLELRNVTLNPAHDRRVRHRQSTLGHHLHQISKAQLVSKVPTHAQNDDLALEVPALEEFIDVRQWF